MSAEASMFRTAAGQARYYAAYDATLALWPAAIETLRLPTRFGTVHVNACGPAEAPALILLPGAAISSTMWYPNIAAFSNAFRVYALDILGDMGKSVSTRRVTRAQDCVDWLADVFDGLQLEHADVAGISMGGFLALKLAQVTPRRVRRLVLISPASLLPLRPQFLLRAAAALLTPFLTPASRQALFLGTASPHAAPAIRQLLTPTDFRYQMFFPPAETDADLRRVQAPTLLLLGEREVIYAPNQALRRATRLIPAVEAILIPGAGHAVSLDQPDMVNQHVLRFLGQAGGAGDRPERPGP